MRFSTNFVLLLVVGAADFGKMENKVKVKFPFSVILHTRARRHFHHHPPPAHQPRQARQYPSFKVFATCCLWVFAVYVFTAVYGGWGANNRPITVVTGAVYGSCHSCVRCLGGRWGHTHSNGTSHLPLRYCRRVSSMMLRCSWLPQPPRSRLISLPGRLLSPWALTMSWPLSCLFF